jgi:hypothetical protein
MESILPLVPPAASLMCTECEGSWPADWLLHWEFTTCPNCGGELRPPLWVTDAMVARGAGGRASPKPF